MSQSGTDSDAQDLAWLRLISGGGRAGEKALESLYRHYRRPLLGFLMHRGVEAMLAEDLVQETFLRVVRAADSFRQECKVSSWIFGIARNLHIDRLRAPDKEDTLDELGWEQIADTVQACDPADAPAVREAALKECFDRGFARYAQAYPQAADVLGKAALLGWSSRDVAQFLDRTEGATREYLSQCRKKLRAFVEPCHALLRDLA